MNIVLFILKMLGVVIAGRATIVGLYKHELFETVQIESAIITVPPTPAKTEQRLTKKGKRAIFLTIIGILTSLFAQGVEQTLNIKRERDSRERAQTQMLLLSNSVQRAQQQLELETRSLEEIKYGRAETLGTMALVQRMLNPMEKFSLKVICEIPSAGTLPSPPLLTNLAPLAKDLVASQHKPSENYTPIPHDYSPSAYLVTLDYGKTSLSYNILETAEGKSLALGTSIDSLKQFADAGQEQTEKQQHLINFVAAPKVTIHVGKNSFADDDFAASSTSSKIIDIQYLVPSGRLLVSWTFDFSKEKWRQNYEMQSLLDLDSSFLTVTFDNWPSDQQTCYERISPGIDKFRHAVYPLGIFLYANDKFVATSITGFPSNGSEGGEAKIGEVPLRYTNLGKYVDQVGIKPPAVVGEGSSAGSAK